ncbi:MAG: VOC family protein [Deltaproteobacteria bacterium]|nr:VOC family protein [Deltaproteobacteria bacterium]
MILGVHHPALAVPDIEAALRFDCEVLGFEIVMDAEIPSGIAPLNDAFGVEDAGCKVRMFRKGNSCIELFEFNSSADGQINRPVNQAGITHICLATDDYAADYEHLAKNGVSFNSPAMGDEGGRWAYGRDPFGNVLELLEHAPEGPTSLRFDT